MDCLFGIVGDGFTLVAADTSACQSIIRMKQGEDKILEASNGKMLLGAVGDGGDRVQFTEFMSANMQLYEYRNGVKLSTHAAANFVRGELATALRKGPYNCNLLVAGYGEFDFAKQSSEGLIGFLSASLPPSAATTSSPFTRPSSSRTSSTLSPSLRRTATYSTT